MSQLTGLIHEEEDPFGPGTDLIISLVALLLFILTVAAIYCKRLEAETQVIPGLTAQTKSQARDLKALKQENEDLKNQARDFQTLKQENQDLKQKLAAKERELKQPGFPPTFNIEATQGFEFDPGKANLTPTLQKYIDNDLVSNIETTIKTYGINTIVVIGHTDGQRLGRQFSTLDDYAPNVLEMLVPPTSLTPASNVDLGMMRALAVVAELRGLQRTQYRLAGIDPKRGFRAYSAGSFLAPQGEWAAPETNNDKSRRRIEVRFQTEKQPSTGQ